MKTKEQWVDEIMESFDGVTPASCNTLMQEKVMQKINTISAARLIVKPRLVWQIAAGFLLLISLNVFSIMAYSKSHLNNQTQTDTIANEYFNYLDTLKL